MQTKRKRILIIATVCMVALSLSLFACQKDSGKSFQLKAKETRPVLDPAMFTGQTRAAYAAAQKYPDLMNEVFCYCYCDQSPFHHASLLSCFTEKHGAGWALCQKEALRVAQLHEEGKSVLEIKRTIDKEFGK